MANKSCMASDKIKLTETTNLKAWITMILRFVVGSVFIYSGFVKAIDPWGTIYKLHDYMVAMNIDLWNNAVLIGAFLLFSIEFMVGIFLVFGCYRRLTITVASLIMLVMLPLTLWIAVFDPVADCGCFGDALVMSNWATFIKNIIISIMIGWLIKFNVNSRCFVIPTLQWLSFIASAAFIIIIGLYGYIYQPLIDYRQYKIGQKFLPEESEESTIEYEFIYEKDGVEKIFHQDNLPGDDWVFKDRRIISEIESETDDQNIAIYDENEDVTDFVIQSEGRQMLLFYSSLGDISIASSYQINSLNDYCNRNDINMIAIASGTEYQIENWKDLSMALYPIYTSEDTAIKEIVRGNPAIVYLEDGIIKWKSSLRAIDTDDFLSDETSDNPMSFARNNKKILASCLVGYSVVMLIIVILSHVPMFIRYTLRKNKTCKIMKSPEVNNIENNNE